MTCVTVLTRPQRQTTTDATCIIFEVVDNGRVGSAIVVIILNHLFNLPKWWMSNVYVRLIAISIVSYLQRNSMVVEIVTGFVVGQ